MKRRTGIIASGIAAMATFALAHNGATGVTLERMKGMTSMRDIMRDIAPLMQGAAPYDALAVSEAGYVIARHAGTTMLELFPENSTTGVTYAKPAIWSDWQAFSTLADDLRAYGEALAAAAPAGLEAPAGPMRPKSDPEVVSGLLPNDARARKIADLMGYSARPSVSSLSRPSVTIPRVEPLQSAELGAGEIFAKISGTCSACHARFRDGRG